MIVLIRKNIMYGGAELLIERLSKAMLLDGREVAVVCNVISPVMKDRFIKNGIHFIELKEWYDFSSWRNFLKSYEIELILTFWVHDFIYFDMLRHFLKIEVKLIHYVITSDDLIVGKSFRNKLIKNIFFEYYKRIVKKMRYSNICVYMDEESVALPEQYYGIRLEHPHILRLPYTCHPLNCNQLVDKRMSQFTILTIDRADLNMKGYILGLLDGFEDFLDKYPNVYLEIVTFGKDVPRIEERINALDANAVSHVTLYGKIQYEQLDVVWKNASVYVGMGTTILDAADKGVIPIPVSPYTERFYSSGLFTDDPTRITADSSQRISGYDMVEKVYSMDTKTYNETRKNTNTCLNKYYAF